MTYEQSLRIELIKLVITFVSATVIGSGLTALWNFRQKRREADLQALAKFYENYGTFLTVLRLWEAHFNQQVSKEGGDKDGEAWGLLRQANEAESAIESILVKVSSEIPLNKRDCEILGRFRQSFQSLRESIETNTPVDWYESDHRQYLAFKRGAVHLASLLERQRWWRMQPFFQGQREPLLLITSNKWEDWQNCHNMSTRKRDRDDRSRRRRGGAGGEEGLGRRSP
ncbi:hypothetical protein [Leptolyngbya ohadii]|uniref:hypothetical protein n=1 Tax=Leptolyngbya ohadii TaxID=1962290 RepID=UPI000B59DCB2|nr:hypothetical protein [Leptolyngbya ohadii]